MRADFSSGLSLQVGSQRNHKFYPSEQELTNVLGHGVACAGHVDVSEGAGVAGGAGSTRMKFTLTQPQLIPVVPHRKQAAIFHVSKSRYLVALG